MSAANFCTMRDFPLFAKDYYPCSRACPLFGDCVTKWYQVRKRA